MRCIDADVLEPDADYDDGDYWAVSIAQIQNDPTIEPEQHWIPASERLPENKTAYYLATIANRGKFFSSTLPDDVETVRWDYDRWKGKGSWHWCTERTVLAWMPLPSPYQEGGE